MGSVQPFLEELYQNLQDGAFRQNSVIYKPGCSYVAFVPDGDICELEKAWKDMCKEGARQNVEKLFKCSGYRKRAPRLVFRRANSHRPSSMNSASSSHSDTGSSVHCNPVDDVNFQLYDFTDVL